MARVYYIAHMRFLHALNILLRAMHKYKRAYARPKVGVVYTELRAQHNENYFYSVDSERLVEDFSGLSGVMAHVQHNGVHGLASSSEYSPESVKRVLEKARYNAETMSRFSRRRLKPIPELPCAEIPVNYHIQALDKALIRSMMDDLYSYSCSKYSSVKKIAVYYTQSASEKILAVHTGLSGRNNRVLGSIGISMESEASNGEKVSAYHSCGTDVYLNDAFATASALYELADKAYEKLQTELKYALEEKITVEGGIHDVILSPEFTGMLAHEAVGHTCEGDAVIRKGSVCAEYMGKQVASELVSLTDFAHSAYGERCPINLYMDDEGTPCVDAPIIKNGILVGCMTNREIAAQLGVPNTGNARASEPTDEPIIRMRNTCFHKGTSRLEDMIASIDKGYYLTKSGGGNGSLKGEFNMKIDEGYEIIHGKLGRRINPTLSSGIAWDALKTVTMVSDNFIDSKQCGICGKKQAIPTSQGGAEMKMRIAISGK